jgi:hypothetical protein
MERIKWLSIATLLIALTSCANGPSEIIACGDDQVIIIERAISNNEDVNISWRWKVSDATDLPTVYQKYMILTDECKPVDGNKKILITSSGGGVVLVDRKTMRSIFYAHVPMAHSAAYLPNDRIVVALSPASGGNSIEVYNVKKSAEVIFKDSLYSGHGVVWMPEVERLFALGYNELRAYSLKNWNTEKPELHLLKKWTLPDNGGLDLTSISDTKLILTTPSEVWVFNTPDEQFYPFELLNQVKNIKSINYNETIKELVYTKAEISWWTHNIYCKNPDKIFTIPEINLYKVRVISERKNVFTDNLLNLERYGLNSC